MSARSVDTGNVNAIAQWAIATLLCPLGNDIPLRVAKDSGTLGLEQASGEGNLLSFSRSLVFDSDLFPQSHGMLVLSVRAKGNILSFCPTWNIY